MRGRIICISDRQGNSTAQHSHGRNISFDRYSIKIGERAFLHYKDGDVDRTTMTSKILDINEDSRSLTLYTENGVYFIAKENYLDW